MSERRRILILGAAGRDFHDFNLVFREDPDVEVVAFTMTQLPGIGERKYPAELAGSLYPHGIPIHPMEDLEELIERHEVDEAVFSYSDVSHQSVMHVASRVLAAGAGFRLLSPPSTTLSSNRPVIAITAVRTGAGKSPLARWLSRYLRSKGHHVAVLRHPMPYGDLRLERVQRFASEADLVAHRCTAEEREEYEPHIEFGNVVFAGVDYADILAAAEDESDVVIWDGGNNDAPFVKPDLWITVVDALRPDQLTSHHPGEFVLRSADVVILNKAHAAGERVLTRLDDDVRAANPDATILRAASPITLADPEAVAGARVIVVEDGPTTTHGGMSHGAGLVAAERAGAAEIIDPRLSAHPLVAEVYAAYPHLGKVLPAIGYNPDQLAALEATIDGSGADVVVSGTPIDLARLLDITTPVVRARYEFHDLSEPGLQSMVDDILTALPA